MDDCSLEPVNITEIQSSTKGGRKREKFLAEYIHIHLLLMNLIAIRLVGRVRLCVHEAYSDRSEMVLRYTRGDGPGKSLRFGYQCVVRLAHCCSCVTRISPLITIIIRRLSHCKLWRKTHVSVVAHKMFCWLGACLHVDDDIEMPSDNLYINFFFFNLKGWRWVCPQTVTPLSQLMCNVIQPRILVRYMWSVNMWRLHEHEHNCRFLSPGTRCQHQHPSKWRHFNYHRRIQRTLHTLTNWNHWSCRFWLLNATMITCNNNDEWRRWFARSGFECVLMAH